MIDVEDVFGFLVRYWQPISLTVFVAVALSAAYVHFGGIELVQHPQFAVIDGYAFSIAFLVGLVVPLGWLLRTRDVSETVALTVLLAYSLFSGLQDILVYTMLGRAVPAELPWLMDAPVGWAAAALGMTTVTREILLGFVAVTGVAIVLVMMVLYQID